MPSSGRNRPIRIVDNVDKSVYNPFFRRCSHRILLITFFSEFSDFLFTFSDLVILPSGTSHDELIGCHEQQADPRGQHQLHGQDTSVRLPGAHKSLPHLILPAAALQQQPEKEEKDGRR